jgi:hypothetical protein
MDCFSVYSFLKLPSDHGSNATHPIGWIGLNQPEDLATSNHLQSFFIEISFPYTLIAL